MNALMIFLIGLLLVISIIWQVKLYLRDRRNKYSIRKFCNDFFNHPGVAFHSLQRRLWIPMIFGVLFFLGTIIWGIIVGFIDEKSTVENVVIWNNILKVFLLFIVFNLKSFFGPIVNCFICCVAVYNLFEYGEIETIALIQPFIEWVFGYFSNWIQIAYWVVFLFSSFAGSIADLADF